MSLCSFFFLMTRRPPLSTRTAPLFPYTTLFRSQLGSTRLYDIPALDAARARFIETEHIGHRRQRQREAAAFAAHDQGRQHRQRQRHANAECRALAELRVEFNRAVESLDPRDRKSVV